MDIKLKHYLTALLPVFAAFNYANSEDLYWVEGYTYFGNQSSIDGTQVFQIARDILDNSDSPYAPGVKNWASAVEKPETKIPSYTYTDALPGSSTRIVLDYANLAQPTYRYAGTPTLNSDLTIDGILIKNCSDTWMTFNVVNSTLTVNNNVEFSSNYTVTTLGGRSGSKLDIKGSVIQKSGDKGFNFMSVLGSIYGRADSVKAGKIQFENKGRISINSSYTEVGSVEFGSYAGRLDLGITDTQGAEVSYRIGGINGGNPDALVTTAASDSMIGNEKSMFTTIVLTPDASKSFSYNGIISNSLECTDTYSSANNGKAISTTTNISMEGSGTQILSGENDFRGYVFMQSGTLYLNTAAGAKHGELTMAGGLIGSTGNATFSSAKWISGGFIFSNADDIHADPVNGDFKTITIDGMFSKNGESKIEVDFAGIDTYDIIDNGVYYDLIYAEELSNFDTSDANTDFAAANIGDANAIFKWAQLDDRYALQVGFTTIPEPATIAALMGALAIGLAIVRRSK